MRPHLKALLFGGAQECEMTAQLLEQISSDHGTFEYHHTEDLEEFEEALATWMPTLVIVLANGAAGLESTYRSRQRRPNLPVFWFSDDREFGMQSYRLECAYFSTKPATQDKIHSALKRCTHIGIPYTVTA